MCRIGVITIDEQVKKLEVGEIFKKAFISLTNRLSAIELSEEEFRKADSGKESTRVMILTKGKFQSYIICSMSKELGEKILLGMNHGEPLEPEEKNLYLKEYMNIICGHGLSDINGKLGAASRLSVPYLGAEEAEIFEGQRETTNKEENICLDSKYGIMSIYIYYSA